MVSPLTLLDYLWKAEVDSKKAADNQVRYFFQYRPKYQREMDAALWHYSRVATNTALEVLFVYHAARGLVDREGIELSGLFRNAAKASSMRDQWQDDVYVEELAESGEIDVERIRADISNEDWNPELLSKSIPMPVTKPIKVLGKKIGEKRRTFNHSVYFNAARLLQQVVWNYIEEAGPEARKVYLENKAAVERFQAKDLAIAAHLAREDENAALKTLGASNYDEAIVACRGLLDKLGIIGGAIPVLIVEMIQYGRDQEAIKRYLYTQGREITRFGQLMFDDIPSFFDDWTEDNPNMLLLPASTSIPAYSTYNPSLLSDFYKQHPTIITELVSPISISLHTAAEELDELNFAGKEAKYSIKTFTKKGLENQRELGKALGVEFDETWYQDAKELESNW
jgi:hypothetical protein